MYQIEDGSALQHMRPIAVFMRFGPAYIFASKRSFVSLALLDVKETEANYNSEARRCDFGGHCAFSGLCGVSGRQLFSFSSSHSLQHGSGSCGSGNGGRVRFGFCVGLLVWV